MMDLPMTLPGRLQAQVDRQPDAGDVMGQGGLEDQADRHVPDRMGDDFFFA